MSSLSIQVHLVEPVIVIQMQLVSKCTTGVILWFVRVPPSAIIRTPAKREEL